MESRVKLKVVNGAGEEQQPRLIEPAAGFSVDEHALAWAARVQAGNRRGKAAHSKSRGKVRGGGAKPWRQKGTGRARQGSIRAVQWRGGGVAFGPGGAEYHRRLNRKQRKRATCSALLDKSRAERLVLVSGDFPAEPRSKLARAWLDKLGISGRVLLLLGGEEKETRRAFRNLVDVRLLTVARLNALDVMNADYLVVSAAADKGLSGLLSGGGGTKE